LASCQLGGWGFKCDQPDVEIRTATTFVVDMELPKYTTALKILEALKSTLSVTLACHKRT